MVACRSLYFPIIQGIILCTEDYPNYPTEMKDMNRVPYMSVVDSFIYAMVCTRLDIT